jgi:hypothetical protein
LFQSDSEKIKQQLTVGKLKEVEFDGIKFYLKRLPLQTIFDLQVKQKAEEIDFEQTLKILLMLSVCDKNGKQVFSAEDEIDSLSFVTLNSLITEVQDYNNLNKEATEKARQELKNLKAQSE